MSDLTFEPTMYFFTKKGKEYVRLGDGKYLDKTEQWCALGDLVYVRRRNGNTACAGKSQTVDPAVCPQQMKRFGYYLAMVSKVEAPKKAYGSWRYTFDFIECPVKKGKTETTFRTTHVSHLVFMNDFGVFEKDVEVIQPEPPKRTYKCSFEVGDLIKQTFYANENRGEVEYLALVDKVEQKSPRSWWVSYDYIDEKDQTPRRRSGGYFTTSTNKDGSYYSKWTKVEQ